MQMWKILCTSLTALSVIGMAQADSSIPEIRKKGRAFYANNGVVCMPHMDENYGELSLCLRKWRPKPTLDPITSRQKFSKCHARLKIDAEGNVKSVKLKKFTGIKALKEGCRRTLFELKFHPVKIEGVTGIKLKDVNFSVLYETTKVKKLRTLSVTTRAVLGNIWEVEDAVYQEKLPYPFIPVLKKESQTGTP